jgi:site-specific recombinase XerD
MDGQAILVTYSQISMAKTREPLTRWGVTYVLQKYVTLAQSTTDVEFPAKVSPHVLRHSKAVHMLQSGVNLIYIRDFLGHSDITTTQIYARVDTETRRRASMLSG